MNYEQFLTAVQKRGCFASDHEAASAVTGVLMAVAEVLPGQQVQGLSKNLPPELFVYLQGTHEEPDPHFDSNLFLGWIVSTFDCTGDRDKTAGGLDLYSHYSGEEAIRRCQCVFSALKSVLDTDQVETLCGCLPEEVQAWFREA